MKASLLASFTIAAILLSGCDPNGLSVPSSSWPTISQPTQNQPILDGAPATPGCLALTQLIAFSGTATLSASSAVSDGAGAGQLALGLVSGVAASGGAISYEGSGSDGSIDFNAESGSGSLSKVQGTLELSSDEWNEIVSELGGSDGQCLQSMTLSLQSAADPDGSSDQMLYGGEVVLTVSGMQFTLSF